MSVYYDKILGKFRDKSVSGGGGSGSQPFAFTADNYTALLAITGMVSGDVAYVSNSQGTQWLPGTVGGNYYANGIYLYTGGSWTSDRNAISYELHLDDERLDALEARLQLTDDNKGDITVSSSGTVWDINTPTVTQSEAEAGTLTSVKRFTPQRVKQAIDALAPSGSASPLTTKGDLYTYDTADARLSIGTNGQALIANSSTATGLEWQALPGQSTGSGTKVLVQGQMDTTQSFTSAAERMDYVDSGFDINSEWDNTTHRFTVGDSGAGVYQFTNQVFVDNSGGWIQIFCKKNGVAQRITATDFASSWDTPMGTTNIELAVGDYVEFWVDSTSSFTVSATWYTLNNFQITKIGESVTIYNAPTDPRVVSNVSTATLTINSSTTDQSVITAQTEALTIAEPTGSPVDGRKLIIRIKDNGTAIGITFNAIFTAIGVTLPTTTTISKVLYIGCIYNSNTTTWDVIAVKEQA
tara:strand:- start:1801 stop:3204 length:1404 start_codon:yes stop_codon:yes gene_type:complete